MDGTLHIDGRVSDAMVVRAMRAVAIDGLGMPADFVRRTRVPQVLVDLLREHPCPHGQGNIRLPFGFSVCGCCMDPCMNTPARLMMAHVDVEDPEEGDDADDDGADDRHALLRRLDRAVELRWKRR